MEATAIATPRRLESSRYAKCIEVSNTRVDGRACRQSLVMGHHQSAVRIRGAERGDGQAVQAFVGRLSRESRTNRFFAPIAQLAPAQLELATRTRFPDDVALIATDARGSANDIVAMAQYIRVDLAEAELGLAVADDWQRRGVGRELAATLFDLAAHAGFRLLSAYVLKTNFGVRRLLAEFGFTVERSLDAQIVRLMKSMVQPERVDGPVPRAMGACI